MQDEVADKTGMAQELEALRRRVAELEAEAERFRRTENPAPGTAREGVSDAMMLRAILDEMTDAIYFKDRESRFLRINRAHAQKFGIKHPAEAIGKTDFDYFTEEHARQAYEDEQRILRTSQPMINVIEKETLHDGRVSWGNTSKLPLRDQDGQVIGTFGMTRDITEMKLMEHALEEERKLLRALLDSLPGYIYVKDRDGRYLANNRAFLQLAGVQQEQVTGRTAYDIYPQELAERFDTADREVYETGCPYMEMAERRVEVDGSERFLMVNKVPLMDDLGDVIGLVGVSHDVTELTQATRKLEAYAAELDEANVELKKFTYIVSHDLRAPLVNLKGFSMELKAALGVIRRNLEAVLPGLDEPRRKELELALNEDVPEALEFINSSVTRMDGFINALLLLSRLGHRELKPEPLSMNELVEATLKTLAHQIEQRGARVAVAELPAVAADKVSMEQIWANLLNNAIVYLAPGRPGTIEVGGRRQGEEAVFWVRDNGRGIRPDDMDKVFAPFRRAGKPDVPGEGMGLSYVQTLVRRHGGNIRCESEAGVGTVFTFTIRDPRN